MLCQFQPSAKPYYASEEVRKSGARTLAESHEVFPPAFFLTPTKIYVLHWWSNVIDYHYYICMCLCIVLYCIVSYVFVYVFMYAL